jgi:phage terminase Nu1 subunit (DNA packaging protein)
MNGNITSGRKLAAAVGVSPSTIREYLAREDWPFRRTPPWSAEDAARIRTWARASLSPNPATLDAENGPGDGLDALRRNPLNAAKLRLALIRAEMLSLQKAILAAEVVPRRDIEEALVRRVHAVRSALQSLPRQLASQLLGQTENAIERTIDDAIRGVLLDMANQIELPEPPLMEKYP